ncbi:MAG: (d)CMP kinase [Wenzhouxiangellaceae bacterium]|nr:(d)CMP kinase [Wenzhouxiangellaceae bacterium]
MSDSTVPVLTIDGPSGAGKGTVAAELARELGWQVLDSGAVYRALALAALDRGLETADEQRLSALARALPLSFCPGEEGIAVQLDGRDVSAALRSEAVSRAASHVAALPAVRAALLDLQRDCRQPPGLVADGRDMGTVVFADAGLKIFLDASVEERARRRFLQLKQKGEQVILDSLLRDMRERDRRDRERSIAPTRPAADAIRIESTGMTQEQVVERIRALARERFGPSRTP